MRCLLFIAGIFLLIGESFGYVIDGNLSDWGVTPGYYNASRWQPNEGVFWIVEDQTGGLREYLGPGYGGQLYDVEAIYFDYDENNAYIAIVTGFCKSGRDYEDYHFYPGDIAIDFGADGSYEYGIRTVGENMGKIYKDVEWTSCVYYSQANPARIYIPSSSPKGMVNEIVYTSFDESYHADPDEEYWRHYVIETSIPLDIFEDDWQLPLRIHWTITCGNDYLDLIVTPEPSSIFLLSLGLFGLGSLLRKKYS